MRSMACAQAEPRWATGLPDVLRELGSQANVLLNRTFRASDDSYEYIAVYVDDLALAVTRSEEPCPDN